MTKDTVSFPSMIIKVVDKKATLPARKGSLRAKRWGLLLTMDGKSITDYYKSCRDAGCPCTANNPRDAVAKGLITLVEPKS